MNFKYIKYYVLDTLMRVILYHFKQIEELESVLDRRQARCVKRQQSLQDMEEVVYASSSVVIFQIVIICSHQPKCHHL